MKKGTIIALIVAVAMIIVGGIILTLGLSFAGEPEQESKLIAVPDTFDKVLIDTEDCEVTFVLYEGAADPYVTLKERENISHSVVVEEGTLKIKMRDKRTWKDFIGLGWENMEMTVYLPQKEYASVRVTTATGRIRIPEVFRIREASLHSDTGRIVCDAKVSGNLGCFTATGSIRVLGSSPETMTLESNTGRIEVCNVTGTELYLDNDTGRTEVENVSCKMLTCESNTGDVTLRSVLAEEYLQVFTDTGDVNIESSDAGAVNIETDTGDVEGHFLTSKWFQVHSDTGRVTVPNTRDGGECRIETDTGDIQFE